MDTSLLRSRIKRALLSATGAAVAFVGVMGLLHTPAGRPYLAKLGFMAPRCPLGLDAVNPRESEPRRVSALQHVRGNELAPSRPAWGFDLGGDRAAVQTWYRQNSVVCTEAEKGMVLTCAGVSASKLPAPVPFASDVDHLTFRFDLEGRLAGVAMQRKFSSQAEAEASYEAMDRSFRAPLGVASSAAGDASLSGPLASRESNYRYRDYMAAVSAANLGDRGLVVRAQAQRIPD